MKQEVKDSLVGNLACFTAYFIFGFNIVSCKNIAIDGHISPIALFFMRSAGSLVLFWITSLVFRIKERVDVRDLWKIALASFLGLFLTQFTFLKAITMTTAVDASIMSLMTPILTMAVAAIVLKERISRHCVVGLAISLAGVLFIVLNSVSSRSGADHTSVWGIILMFINAGSFAIYVGVFRNLIKKYNVVTFMKWMFLFSTLYALPLSRDVLTIEYSALSPEVIGQVLFVVVCATFISYFLIPIGQKKIRPVMVSMYVYLQPVIAMGISLATGLDTLTWPKALATLLVFLGVGIVNFTPRVPRLGKLHPAH